ncbi:MAG: hypothetical protein LBQ60_05905 [Bacteroidales bacterium]|jgi:hypothetical protein|nr:hypothetical protein [Bacteroidales bacterium]
MYHPCHEKQFLLSDFGFFIRKGISFVILFCIYSVSYAQNIPQHDIDILNKKLFKKLKKTKCYTKNENYKIIHTFWVQYDKKIDKDDFLNQSFLTHLKPSYHKYGIRKRNYLNSYAKIINSKRDIVAFTDGNIMNCIDLSDSDLTTQYVNMIETIEKLKINLLFYIMGTNLSFSFGVTEESKIFVFRQQKNLTEIFTINEFVNCCWVDWD